jgi:riboflavin biosynthesis pyrimidine reductase
MRKTVVYELLSVDGVAEQPDQFITAWADVVDELRLVIAPTIVGPGRRLLDGLPSIQLEAIRSVTSPTGHLLVDYRVLR